MANEFSFQTSKGDILKNMMRKSETADLIREALASSLGSTSRTKAKKIFSIMSKLHTSNSGIGGPGISEGYSQMAMPETNMVEDNISSSKGMVIFNKIPKTRIIYGKKPHDDSVEHNNLIKEMRNFSRGKFGMGGPGYDGRGGFWGNAVNWAGTKLGLIQPKSDNGMLTYTGVQPSNTPDFLNLPSSSGGEWTPDKLSSPTPSNVPTNIAYDVNQQFGSTPLGTMNVASSGSNAPTLSDKGQVKNVVKPLESIQWTPSVSGTPAGKTTPEGINWATGQPTTSGAYTPSIVNPSGVMSMPGINMSNQPTGLFGGKDLANLSYQKTTEPVDLATADLSVKKDTALDETKTTPGVQGEMEKAKIDENIKQRLTILNTLIGEKGGQCGALANDYLGDPGRFGDSFESKKNNITTLNPEVGAIAVFDMGPNGHVAIVDSINEDGTINIIESNVDGSSETITKRTVAANSALGYYVPGQVPTSEALAIRGASTSLTGDAAIAAAALAAGVGSTAFGAKMASEKMGTLSEIAAANEASIWDKYNIDEQRADVDKMTAEGVLLPKDVTAYITARDQYLVQTDKEIANYIDNIMKNTDMSDPANAAKANAQLNYLYTLRGRQNQSYIGYLNDAVEQHTNALNAKINKYNGDITVAERKLESANAISTKEYEIMAAGFSEMYTDLKNAPMEESLLVKSQSEARILKAQADQATSGIKQLSQLSYIDQGNKLEGYTWDAAHMVTPGSVDLVERVKLFYTDPNNKDITVQNVIQTYLDGVQNYLSASEQKDATTGKGITPESKLENAKDAVKQLSNLANFFQSDDSNNFFGSNEDRTVAVLNAINAVTGAKQSLAGIMASRITTSGNVPKIMETVQGLAPGGSWYTLGMGRGTPPTADQFVKNMANATGDTLDESIARAIYAVYQRFVTDSENQTTASEEFVKELVQMTPAQFAQTIGNLYAQNYNPFG